MASESGQGTVLGERYRLERVVGTGGMAAVWLARDERLDRQVAVKLLSDTLAHDESYIGRFRREARLAAGLSHPNLVKVYDFGGEGERPYLVMEYVEGETLGDRIAAGTAAELDAERLARELLDALGHIHEAGIVHRDIKPANVLIGPDGAARVTDFGIARPEDATRLTSTGMVIGTRSYMAPEVLRGEPATVRSDLYACGVLIEEGFGASLPPHLAGLAARLADEDPARRPESAPQALALLAGSAAPTATAATETAPTQALPPDRTLPTTPPGGTTRPFDRRLLGGLALLAALVVLGFVLLAGGDDSPSSGGAGDRNTQTGEQSEGSGQADGSGSPATTAEEPATDATPTETTPTETDEAAPSAKPEKVEAPKESKAPKAPPGKAKGLSKP